MNLISLRIITDDVARLVTFYERVTGIEAKWAAPNFAEINTPTATLAIAATQSVTLFAPDAARPAANHSVIIEFLVEDVDGVYKRLTDTLNDVVIEPTTMPWGNRSLLVRDPDGNLINLFTPVTPAAMEKFAGR